MEVLAHMQNKCNLLLPKDIGTKCEEGDLPDNPGAERL